MIDDETRMTAMEKMRYVEDIERDAQKTTEWLEKWGFSSEQILEYTRIMRNSENIGSRRATAEKEAIFETIEFARGLHCLPDDTSSNRKYRNTTTHGRKAKGRGKRRRTSGRKARRKTGDATNKSIDVSHQ